MSPHRHRPLSAASSARHWAGGRTANAHGASRQGARVYRTRDDNDDREARPPRLQASRGFGHPPRAASVAIPINSP